MTYEETLSHIYGRGRFGMKPGLERITSLLQALQNPHENVVTVHVAGTNGKGSISAFLAEIFAASGLKAGLFTSPHLIAFTERVRINGREIGEREVVQRAERILSVAPPDATFFEIVTALAFLHFAEEGVDIAVMEAGMGGRFDATNVTSGVLSVLSPISLDHCDYLGDNVAAIASDKAGIIRCGRPVVLAPQPAEARAVLEERCLHLGAPCYRCGEEFSAAWKDARLTYRGLHLAIDDMKPGIGGSYQSENAACALAAAELLAAAGYPVTPRAMRQGIEEAAWPGRMEFFGAEPSLLLDGAHNPAAAAALASALATVRRSRLVLVLGVMGDKDLPGIVEPLLPLAAHVVTVTPALARSFPSAELAAFCRNRGAICTDGGTVSAGVAIARSLARETDLVVITGSLFTVGEARAFLLGRQFEPFRG